MAKRKTEPEDKTAEGIEYHCSAFFSYNKLKKQQEYCIRLETVKLFTSLNYKLTVKADKKKKELNLNIAGLLPDHSYLSEVKPAISDNIFNELYGEYTINIIRQDGITNSARYNFNIYKRELTLVEDLTDQDKQIRRFCSFHTAEDLNTFS